MGRSMYQPGPAAQDSNEKSGAPERPSGQHSPACRAVLSRRSSFAQADLSRRSRAKTEAASEQRPERGSMTRSKLERKIDVVKSAASRAGGRTAGHRPSRRSYGPASRPALRKSARQTLPLLSVLTHF